MKSVLQSLAITFSVVGLVACGTKSASNPAAKSSANKVAATASAKMTIVNAESFEKIHADENDVAEFLAVDGQVLDRAAVEQADPESKKVRCMSRIQNVRFENGKTIDQVKVEYASSKTQQNMFYANLNRISEQADQGFALVCTKAGSAVTATEVKAALQGIVELSL